MYNLRGDKNSKADNALIMRVDHKLEFGSSSRVQGGGRRRRMFSHRKGTTQSEMMGSNTRKLDEETGTKKGRKTSVISDGPPREVELRRTACPNHVALRFSPETAVVEVERRQSGLTTFTGGCG